MTDIYVVLNDSGIAIAAICAINKHNALMTALSSHHDAIDGSDVIDLNFSHSDTDGNEYWKYRVDDDEITVLLSLCGYYE